MSALSRLALVVALTVPPTGAQVQPPPADFGFGDSLPEDPVAIASAPFDDSLEVRVLGDIGINPAARIYEVRGLVSPAGTKPVAVFPVARGRGPVRRSECTQALPFSNPSDYWAQRASPSVAGYAMPAPPVDRNGEADRGQSGAPARSPWCEPMQTLDETLEPLGRALWGPLLVVLFGTFAFWTARGFRRP